MSASFFRQDVAGSASVIHQSVCDHGSLAPFTSWGGGRPSSARPLPGVHGALGHHGLTRLRQLLEPLGHVHRVPDEGVLQPLLRPEECRRRLAGRQPQAQPEGRQALLLPLRLMARCFACMANAAATARSAWSSWANGAPNTAITASPTNCITVPFSPEDGVVHGRTMHVELPRQLARIGVLGDGRVRADVAHENGHHDPLGLADLPAITTKLLRQPAGKQAATASPPAPRGPRSPCGAAAAAAARPACRPTPPPPA